MDGIANVAKHQQTQMSSQNQMKESQQTVQIQQPKEVNVVKDMHQQSGSKAVSEKINSKEQVEKLVKELNKALSPMSTNIKFGVDQQDIFYVSVIEAETSKMLRRFPAEEAVDFLPKMQEVTGILFDKRG